MPSNKNLNIALRITADLKKALQEMGVFKKSLDSVEQSTRAADAATRQAATSRAAAAKATAQTTTAQKNLKTATDGTTASWKAVAAAQTAAMASATRQRNAAEAQAKAAARVAAETQKEDAALQKLMGSLKTTALQLQRLDQQQRLLESGFKRGKISADQLAQGLAAIRSKRDALKGIDADAKRANASMQTLSGTVQSMHNVLVAGVAGVGVVSIARDVVRTNLAYQQATYTMQAATDSAAEAAAQLAYARDISQELGLEFLSTSQNYARLLASAKNTPELLPYMEELFKGVSQASTALHLAPDEFNRVMLAMEQMVSKGRIQTQELVLQFGQAIPGAFQLAADAMGVTTEELIKLLEAGDIAPEEFLPRFGRTLQERFGPTAQKAASGLQAELNRLSNAWTEMKINAGDAGFIDSYTTAVRDLTKVMSDPAVAEGFNTIITGLGGVVSWSVKATAAVGNFTRWAGEELAVDRNGIARDDVIRLEQEADKIRAMLNGDRSGDRIRFFGPDGIIEYWNDDELKASLAEIEAAIADHYKRMDELRKASTRKSSQSGEVPVGRDSGRELAPYEPSGASEDNERFVKELEKEAATLGKTEAQIRRYQVANRELTPELRKRADAALAGIAATEKQMAADEQAQKDLEKLADLQVEYLEATGRTMDAAAAQIEQKYGELRDRLIAKGDEDGANLVESLINVERAKAELEELQVQIDRIFSNQARREQSIQTQQQAGLIGEAEARREIVDLHQKTADQVEQLLPRMRELAEATGDPAAVEKVENISIKLEDLRLKAIEVGKELRNAFETSLANALEGLATGTHSLREAAQAFVRDIGAAIARLAAQNLAEAATDGLIGLFGGGKDKGADLTSGAAAVTGSAAALGVAGGTLLTGAAAIEAAAISLAAANVGGSASGGSGGGETNWVGIASQVIGLAAATGGHVTGPGTTTSDSIPAMLSNQEFVTRAAVVTQPGALNFLHDFNKRGMAALEDWTLRVRHSTGGLAGVPAPAMSNPTMGVQQLSDPSVDRGAAGESAVSVRFVNVVDPELMADFAQSPEGEQVYMNFIKRNSSAVKRLLGS